MRLRPITRGTWWRGCVVAAVSVAIPAQAAQTTRRACLGEADVQAMAAYALPSAISGLVQRCSPHLAAQGFLRSHGANLAASYATGKQAAWPRAKQALLGLAGTGAGAGGGAAADLPDEALQPFVEGMIGSMIANELKPGQCVEAERVVRLLAPLPRENVVELVGLLAALGGRDGKKPRGGLELCGR